MHIQITIQRPVLTLVTVLAVAAIVITQLPASAQSDGQPVQVQAAQGGTNNAANIIDARAAVQTDRIKQQVLAHEEDIWRYQVDQLSQQMEAGVQAPETADQLQQSRSVLLSIIRQKAQAEKMLAESIDQLLQVEGTAVADDVVSSENFTFAYWPVEPKYGLSAYFKDPGYKDHFHVDHFAIDIPTEQGTTIRAPEDGIVEKYADNGYGYSYLVLRHGAHLQTIYGHITQALVKEGQSVKAGQAIALSGGRIGSKGAGSLTTGPHLHFAIKIDGKLADPLPHLQPIQPLPELQTENQDTSVTPVPEQAEPRRILPRTPASVPSAVGGDSEIWSYEWK